MDKVQRGNGASNDKAELRPYYEWNHDREDRRRRLSTLVAFDISETFARLRAWLADSDYGTSDEYGNLSVTVPEPTPNEPKEATKARAIRALELSLFGLEFSHGPERAAGQQWHDALADLRSALDRFTRYAKIRLQEDSYIRGRTHGDKTFLEKIASRTRRTLDLASTLSVNARVAQRGITTYGDDPLPIPGTSGRPTKTWLAQAEARLSLAGFRPSEIANLITDNARRRDGHGAAARKSHRKRIEGRIKSQKPAIVRKRREMALADASLTAFIERTGADRYDPVKSRAEWIAARAKWFDSPEHKALEEQLAKENPGENPGG